MIEQYDVPYTDLEQSMIDWVQEALELRHGKGGDPEGKIKVIDPRLGIDAMNSLLTRVRKRADRVDELLAHATMARGRFRRARDQAAFSAEIAYDEATSQNKENRARIGEADFSTREERNAAANLLSLNEKRAAHEARRLVSVAEEAYDVISQIHWQLDAIRKDLRASLHSLQFESKLEN